MSDYIASSLNFCLRVLHTELVPIAQRFLNINIKYSLKSLESP